MKKKICYNYQPVKILIVVFVLLVTQGCVSIQRYVSHDYTAVVDQLNFAPDKPIAREIKFIFASGNIVSGIGGNTNFLIATNLESKQQINDRGQLYIKEKYPSVSDEDFVDTSQLSNIINATDSSLAAPGRAAQAKLSSGNSLSINEAAAAQNREFAEAMDSSIDMMNASLALMQSLENWVKSSHEADGYALVNWVRDNTGAVGSVAPEGSVLHLDFIRVLKGRSFNLSSKSEIIVSAYLERPGRKNIYATKGFQYFVYSDAPPPEEIEAMTDYKIVSAGVFTRPQFKELKGTAYAIEYALLANAVIHSIYQQLE